MSFSLHPRLAAGSHFIGRSVGCQIFLKNNATFPWFLIVPEVEADLEDLHQLPLAHFQEVTFLIRSLSEFVENRFEVEKLNVACIGNVVRQMHIHIVGRSSGDPAWPGTVWASDAKSVYDPEAAEEICKQARSALGL